MSRDELVESIFRWTAEAGIKWDDWDFGWEDEGFITLTICYDMEEENE